MSSKRARSRQQTSQAAIAVGPSAENNSTAAQPLAEAQVLAAVDARRAAILQHATTLTPATLLSWLRHDLGLPDESALRPHRKAAKQRARQLLSEEGQLASGSGGAAPAASLPPDLLPAVLRYLDHDSLFCAVQTCRAWHAAASGAASAGLWQQQCHARGWQLDAAPAPQQRQQQQQQPGFDWRQRYRQQYANCCYDCFQPTQRRTLAVGSLRLRLCQTCSQSYVAPRPWHRLMAASAAKRQCLKDQDLARLPHCVEPNPVNPAFHPMHLYRRLELRRAAVARWGSWEAVQAEHRRRITR